MNQLCPHPQGQDTDSPTTLSGPKQIGSVMKPFSYFFTRLTIAACSSGVQLWWMTPSPPCKANEMAIRSSVTVSIGELRNGV